MQHPPLSSIPNRTVSYAPLELPGPARTAPRGCLLGATLGGITLSSVDSSRYLAARRSK
jgi:hypothetical protein